MVGATKFMTMINVQKFLVIPAALASIMLVEGCATKKYVQKTVDPIQQHVDGLDKKVGDQASEIESINGNLSKTKEQLNDVSRSAAEANAAAARANENANSAGKRAEDAMTSARTADGRVTELKTEVDRKFEMLGNYSEMTKQSVFFGFDKSVLAKESTAKLDELVAKLGTAKLYVIEVTGYTDPTGSKDYNTDLSQKRAEAVVRYLANKNIPIRNIHVLGLGQAEVEKVEGKTRAELRKESRRVDVTVYVPGSANAMQAQGN